MSCVAVTIRTSELPFRLHDFTLRVASPADCEPLAPEARGSRALASAAVSLALLTLLFCAPQAVDTAAAAALAAADAPLGPEAPPAVGLAASAVVAAARSGDAPHFAAFRSAFVDALRFGDQEAVDHPVACLLVQAAPLAGDPVRAFADQFRGDNMPSSLRAGHADPVLLRHHLLLHDASAGGPDAAAQAEAVRAEVAVTFGAGAVTLLTVNSRFAAGAQPQQPLPDVWTPTRCGVRRRHPPPAEDADASDSAAPQPPPGHCMTADDVARVRAFVEDFAAKQLIPFIESKAVSLSAQIAATRKGLRNTLKSLWKGKEPRAVELPPDGAYHHGSPEAQLRLCADLAMMLRDYELAAGHLRLVAQDFRADRAQRQAGAASEALGCALAAADAPRREIDAAFDAAWTSYRLAPAPRGAQLAARAALLHGFAAGVRGGDAAAPLVRASCDAPDAAAAAMLEAAASAHAAAAPPRLRKAAFHAVLAGHRYTLAGARPAAVRAYSFALPLLSGRRWRHGESHIHFALARHLAHATAMPAAAAHFGALLGAAPGARAAHASYLREFAFVAEACASAGAPLPPLPLAAPGVDTRRVRCASEDHRAYGGAAARQLPEEAWAALENGGLGGGGAEPLVPPELAAAALAPAGGASTNWLDGAAAAAASARGSAALAEQACNCCAGESVCVDVAVHNPLATALDVTGLRLEATFSPAAAGADADAAALAHASGSPNGSASAAAAALFDGALETEEQSLQLQPGERVTVRLRATPPARGELRLRGVAWALAGGLVPGCATFDVAAPRRRRTGPSAPWERDVPPPSRLLFRVGPPAPRLAATLEGLPDAAPQGSILRLTLRLTNVGVAPLHRLRLATSSPLLLPAPGIDDADAAESERQRPWPAPFAFPTASASLAPGGSAEWPLWLHAADSEQLAQLQVSIFYAPADSGAGGTPAPGGVSRAASGTGLSSQAGPTSAPPLRFRVLRLAASLALRPLLRCELAACAADGAPRRRLLQLGCAAAAPTRPVWLRAAAAAGAPVGATLRVLGGPPGEPGEPLSPGAACAVVLALDEAPPGGKAPISTGTHALAVALDGGDARAQPPHELRVPPSIVEAFVLRALAAAARASAPVAAASSGGPQQGATAMVVPMPAAPLLVALDWWAPASAGGAACAGLHVLRPAPPTSPPPALRACLSGPCTVALPSGSEAGLTARLPLTVQLRNEGSTTAHPLLELLPADTSGAAGAAWRSAGDGSGGGARGPPAGARYGWVGVTRKALPPLPPGALAEVPITALVAAPGLADITRWRLSWRLEGEPEASTGAPTPEGGARLHAQHINPPFVVAVAAAE